jgi:hypothetical protein
MNWKRTGLFAPAENEISEKLIFWELVRFEQ